MAEALVATNGTKTRARLIDLRFEQRNAPR